MTRLWFRCRAAAILVGSVAVSSALAQQAATSDTQDQIQRLEALIAQQEKKLDEMRQQIAIAASQDTDAARTAAMREQIRSILNEREFRESMMPSTITAGYDDGFYIKSSDDQFSMKVNGLFQFRWTYYNTQTRNRYLLPRRDRDDRTGFDIQRLRVILSGNLYGQDLTYLVDLRSDAPDGYDFVTRYAYVNYHVADEFQIQAGMFQLAGTRSALHDNGGFQLPDRGLFDAVYSAGEGVGVRFWGQLFEKRLDYMLDIANSLNGDRNRTITPDPAELDNNPAIVFRTVWHILGDDLKTWQYEGDVDHHESPHWDLGFNYVFNEDKYDFNTTRIPYPSVRNTWNSRGGYGLTSTNGAQINQFGLDTAFKYMGFSALAEYAVRVVDPRRADRAPLTPWYVLTGDGSTTAQHGAHMQLGYFLPIPGMEKKLEAVARVGGISALADGREGSWEYGGGLNYYIQGNKVKLQTDVFRIYELPTTSSYASFANVNDDALVWRVQLQVAF